MVNGGPFYSHDMWKKGVYIRGYNKDNEPQLVQENPLEELQMRILNIAMLCLLTVCALVLAFSVPHSSASHHLVIDHGPPPSVSMLASVHMLTAELRGPTLAPHSLRALKTADKLDMAPDTKMSARFSTKASLARYDCEVGSRHRRHCTAGLHRHPDNDDQRDVKIRA